MGPGLQGLRAQLLQMQFTVAVGLRDLCAASQNPTVARALPQAEQLVEICGRLIEVDALEPDEYARLRAEAGTIKREVESIIHAANDT